MPQASVEWKQSPELKILDLSDVLCSWHHDFMIDQISIIRRLLENEDDWVKYFKHRVNCGSIGTYLLVCLSTGTTPQ